jgi:site-specific DNA recombinase
MGEVRAAIYARTTSDQPSIGYQLVDLRARVAEDAVRVPVEREFIDDGYSGATLVRPGLDRLRELIAAGGVERLYVHAPDRLARTCALHSQLVQEFRAAGVNVVFVHRGRAAPEGLTLGHA